jgi:hypothetical protein
MFEIQRVGIIDKLLPAQMLQGEEPSHIKEGLIAVKGVLKIAKQAFEDLQKCRLKGTDVGGLISEKKGKT